MIVAMMLFGSAARGDFNKTSDTDLLCVVPEGKPSSVKRDSMEMQILPEQELMRMAKRGDLFAIHLALEGIVIFDYNNIFSRFKDSLKFRNNYAAERDHAIDLAFFLLQHGADFDNFALVNKRVAWCVRTYLISILADRGEYVFSPNALFSRFKSPYVERLINLRRDTEWTVRNAANLAEFLKDYGGTKIEYRTKNQYRNLFLSTKNKVASATLDILERNQMKNKPLDGMIY